MKKIKIMITDLYYSILFNKKYKSKLLFIPILTIIGMSSWLYGYKYRDQKIINLNTNVILLNSAIDSLVVSNDTLSNSLVDYYKLKDDGDYYRYIAFKHSNIFIPKLMDVTDLKLIYSQAYKYNIPKKYIFRLINKESRYNPNAKSHMGASGYMQVMPKTFNAIKRRYVKINGSIEHLDKNKQNILVGTFYLNYLYKKYNRWDLTFAAYNCGSGNVEIAGFRIPNIPETKNYVKYIMNI